VSDEQQRGFHFNGDDDVPIPDEVIYMGSSPNAESSRQPTEKSSDGLASATPDLIRQCDVKGILHSHTRYCDGAHSLFTMVDTAQQIGLEYIGISDHFRSEVHRNGIDLQAVRVQRQEIDGLRKRLNGFDILHGVEVDANPDGSLSVNDEVLAQFDYVIASLPENPDATREELTAQVIAVIRNPLVTILGKPIGDLMLRPPPLPVDLDAVLAAASQTNTAVEIDANPQCYEINWSYCQKAQALDVMMIISPNAHRAARLVDYRHGVELARDAGVCCRNIMNTLSSFDLRRFLRRA